MMERKVTHKRKEAIPLPEGSTDNNRFRAVFVTTYICWVAEYADPWRVEPEEATGVMQKIWAEVYGKKIPFKITTETKAYQQVHRNPSLSMDNVYSRCIQADQRVRDSWRTAFGSAGMSAVNEFFKANEKLFSTDESRQQFASDILIDLKFLYSITESDNPKVRPSYISTAFDTHTTVMFLHRSIGAFSGVHLLSRHFLATFWRPKAISQ